MTFILTKMSSKYEALVLLVLSGERVSRELADLLMLGSQPSDEPTVELFSAPAADLESLISAGLDSEFPTTGELAA